MGQPGSVSSSQLVFDESVVERLEIVYRGRDVVWRRSLVLEALGPHSGERILDVGCGPGFYVGDVVSAVGPAGSVTGIDSSPQMLAVAAHRCSEHANVAFHEADAIALPTDDAAYDAALSVQVLEYVRDIPSALTELHRSLRPGGRLVIWDVDWSTVSWHSGDPERMERVLGVWDGHLADPALPRTLGSELRHAGFDNVATAAHAFVSTEANDDTYGGLALAFVEQYVGGTGELPRGELEDWAAEQRELDAAGEFFFACTQFCFTATRPVA
jgi:arsenite methyltransferase